MCSSPWRSVWSGSIGSGAIWMAISPKRRRIARRRGARARNRSARARRAWSARLPGRAAQIAATSCCRVSTPTVSARAAISNCTAASSASTLTPPCASSAPSRSPSASPKKTPVTTAPFTNSAPRSKRTRPPRLRWPRLLCLRPVRRVLTTPARPSTIFSRSSGGPSRRSFSFAHRNLQSEGVSRSFGPHSPYRSRVKASSSWLLSRQPRRVGEQRGFLLWIAGDALELRIVVAQRFGHLHLRAGEDADQLQRIHHALALEMVVGDDKGGLGAHGEFADALGPGFKFRLAVEVVVALLGRRRRVIAEPRIVPPPVQPDVAHRRGGPLGRLERPADHWLIYVAKTHAVLVQQVVEAFLVPGGMPHLHDQRVIGEPLDQFFQIRDVIRRMVERKRELQQHRAQLAGVPQQVKSRPDGALVFRGGSAFVREFLPEFRGEQKPRVRRHACQPLPAEDWPEGLVERRVDLDGVEEFGQVSGFVELAGPPRRVDDPGPVGVGPARRAHPHDARGVRLRRLARRQGAFDWGDPGHRLLNPSGRLGTPFEGSSKRAYDAGRVVSTRGRIFRWRRLRVRRKPQELQTASGLAMLRLSDALSVRFSGRSPFSTLRSKVRQ